MHGKRGFMDCNERAELTPLYLCGELDKQQAADFDVHIKSCSGCAAELQRQARLDARLHDVVLAEQIDTASLDGRIRQQIAQSPEATKSETRRGSRRGVTTVLGIAAAFALLVFAGHRFLLGSHVAQVYADAATDDRMEVVELQPRPWSWNSAQINSLAEKTGVPTSALQALQRGPYHLQRAKICFLDKHLFLHAVFSDGRRELSMFLRQRDTMDVQGTSHEMVNGKLIQTADVNGEHVALFETPQLIVMVATSQSNDAALGLARYAASAL
jgi:hypothetical protein